MNWTSAEHWRVALSNAKTEPQRWAASWLRRRGWVVFYLEPRARTCPAAKDGPPMDCWLALYQQTERTVPEAMERGVQPHALRVRR